MADITYQNINGDEGIMVLSDGIEQGIIWNSPNENDGIRWMLKGTDGRYMRKEIYSSIEEAKKAIEFYFNGW